MHTKMTRIVAPIRQQAVEILRRAIASQALKPGTRLIERQLCESLQVSRVVLREGLRQLEAEGLLARDSRGRLIVARVTKAQAEEIYAVRAALEGLAGRLFAEGASDEDIARLREAYGLLLDAASQGVVNDSFLEVKDHFYDVLLSGSRNDTLRKLLTTLYWRITLLRVRSIGQPGRVQRSLQEIGAIVDAIERRDGDAAERMCIQHVQHARETVLRALAEQPANHPDDTTQHRP